MQISSQHGPCLKDDLHLGFELGTLSNDCYLAGESGDTEGWKVTQGTAGAVFVGIRAL